MKWVAGVLLLGLGMPLRAQDTIQRQEQPIRAEVNLVTVRFTVKTAAGQFINTLRREDFSLAENGILRDLQFFEAPRNSGGAVTPLWLAFLLDVSGSTFATRTEEIVAAQAFLDNVHDFTRLGIFGFTDKLLPFQDFTPNRQAALRAFTAARRHLGQTAIYESVEALLSLINARAGPQERKIIIVISDGVDHAYSKVARTITLARAAGVTFYTIMVPSAAQLYIGPARENPNHETLREQEKQEQAFASLSVRTGGRHSSGFEAILDFDDTLALINDDIFGNLYSLGYYTDDPYRDKQEREIGVRVNRPDAHVSALFRNLPQRSSAKKQFIAALFDNEAIARLPENLHTNFHEIGAEMDLLTARREGGQLGVPFRIKISPYALQGNPRGDVRTQFGVIGLVLDKEGNEVVRLREVFRVTLGAKEIQAGRGIIYTNKLLVPPGVYDLKVALLEIPSWKMTAFESILRVTDP